MNKPDNSMDANSLSKPNPTPDDIYRKIADDTPVIIWTTQLDGSCTYLNRKWYDYTGQTLKEGLQFGWLDMVHPDDIEQAKGIFLEANKHQKAFSIEYRLKDKHANYRWHLDAGNPRWDDQGNYLGFIGTVTDIHERKLAEESLRASENYYKKYAEAMPQMAFIADAEGNIRFYNQRWYEYVAGMKGTEGWGWQEKPIHHPDDLERTIQRWKHSLSSGEPYEIEYRLRRHDGVYRWHLGRASPVFNLQGNIEFWFGTNTDIQKFKETETKLIESKAALDKESELLNTLFDNIPVMLTVWDPELKVNDFNKTFVKITGWTAEEARKGIMELAYPDPTYRREVEDYMKSLTPDFKDIVMTIKNGQTIHTSWANIKLSDGRKVGIGLDISKRKEYEFKLLELTERLQTIFRNIDDGLLVYNAAGDLIDINPAALDLFKKLSASDPFSYDKLQFQLFDQKGNELPEIQWPRNRCRNGEHFVKEEIRTLNKVTESELYLEYSSFPILVNDVFQLGILTIHDITESKKIHMKLSKAHDELQISNTQLSKINQLHHNLLYILAHDLKNPLNNIKMISSIIQDEIEQPETLEMLNSLDKSISRQENILNGLVEIIQVKAGEEIAIESISFTQLMKEVLEESQMDLVKAGGNITYDFKQVESIRYIKQYLYSTLKNLISNAIKYRRSDSQLHIQLKTEKRDGFTLLIIRDNGIGIDLQKHKNQLFQPFKRFSEQAKGTGIGLYIINNIIENNGGYIEVESTPGKGTTFYCYLKEYQNPS